MKASLIYIAKALVIIFAVIGFVLTAGYFAIRFGWTNASGVIDIQRETFLSNGTAQTADVLNMSTQNSWEKTPEWQTLKSAILKDQGVIDRAAATSGVPARLIVENLIAEQLRFYFDDRTSYEQFFAPLKILGSETQFSWGVMGVKETTAVEIENNLTNINSPYYLGMQYANLLNFSSATSTSISEQRFVRMTNQDDHYYSYLYAGLYIHEVENQWHAAGFPIANKPDIIATLYNIGFSNSKPNAQPQSGGAAIPLGTQTWSFGSLAKSFYDSDELINEFPRD
jgi:hypothetical protein